MRMFFLALLIASAVIALGFDLSNDTTKREVLSSALKDLSDALNSVTQKRSSGGVPCRRELLGRFAVIADKTKRSGSPIELISEAFSRATDAINTERKRESPLEPDFGNWGNGGGNGDPDPDLSLGGEGDDSDPTPNGNVVWTNGVGNGGNGGSDGGVSDPIFGI